VIVFIADFRSHLTCLSDTQFLWPFP